MYVIEDKRKFPLRKIVNGYADSIYGRVENLECGHKTIGNITEDGAKSRRCRECYLKPERTDNG